MHSLAESLAGERGRNIAASMPYPQIMAWALVIRTVAIDALIADALALGIDAVINLGAGLDTRPYRMNLFRYWIQEYYMGGTKRWAPRRMRDRLKDSPFRFEEPDWLSFFERHGWTILENRIAADEAACLKRPFPLGFPWTAIMRLLPARVREKWRNSSGYVMYVKPITATEP